MKTKRQFIEEIYFECKSTLTDGDIVAVEHEGTKLRFYLDEGNETLQVLNKGKEFRSIFHIEEGEAYDCAKAICEGYFGMEAGNVSDERFSVLEKGIKAWYDLTSKATDDVKKFFESHKDVVIDIDLGNDRYFLISLERKVMFKYIRMNDDGHIMVGISEPVYFDNQIYEYYDHEIDMENVFQDAVVLFDVMSEFYKNTREYND